MKKKIVGVILSAVMAISLVACASQSTKNSLSKNKESSTVKEKTSTNSQTKAKTQEQAERKVGKTVFKLSFNQSIENPEAKTLIELSNKLYDATEGRYSIEVYPNEQLGNQKDSLESVQNGAVEMALVANTIIENVNPDFAIIGTPYVYDSVKHQQKLFQSGALDELFASTEKSGFKTLAAYGLGARCVYGKKPYKTPADLSGQKIRVMQSETMTKMMNLMGGVGVPMAQGDVYSAIQSGTLDGAENNIITYVDLLQHEVAPYFSKTAHLMIPDELVMNKSTFDAMSKQDQEALLKAAKESIPVAFEKCAKLRQEYYKKAKDELGVTIVEPDTKAFQEKLMPMIEKVAAKSPVTKKIYEELKKLK